MGMLLMTAVLTGCGGGSHGHHSNDKKGNGATLVKPQTECIVKTTPVKNQGQSDLCWAYAMLATIESEHLMKGDSVNLSVDFVARKLLEEEAKACYLTRGKKVITTRGMSSDLIDLILRHGLTHWDAFHSDVNYRVLGRKVEQICKTAYSGRRNLGYLNEQLRRLLDDELHPELRFVFMLGMEYTPQEFARSVCREDEYQALTSFTHHPFGEDFILEVPDNRGHSFRNIPLDSLQQRIDHALTTGHPVCWEGDTSEDLFSFKQGLARMKDEQKHITQEMRQQGFERFETTDDHCMELIGIARTPKGKRLYICKNSWGTDNPFGGLMYMTENYLRAKTIAVWLSDETG